MKTLLTVLSLFLFYSCSSEPIWQTKEYGNLQILLNNNPTWKVEHTKVLQVKTSEVYGSDDQQFTARFRGQESAFLGPYGVSLYPGMSVEILDRGTNRKPLLVRVYKE